MKNIVILDGYTANPGDLSWDGLSNLGTLTVYDRTPAGETVSRIGSAEIVLTNKTVIDRGVMEACPSLAYIGVLATGYNVVDVPAAAARALPLPTFPPTARLLWRRQPLRSCWKSATGSPLTAMPSMPGAGPAVPTSVSGTIRS